jgi:hypothetical protein
MLIDWLTDPNKILIQIDRRYSATRILESLNPFLKEQTQTSAPGTLKIMEVPTFLGGGQHVIEPSHPTELPPITSIRTWLDYLKCYDAYQHHPEWKYSRIAKEVWKNHSLDDRARLGIERVKRLIISAQINMWPPSSGYLFDRKPKAH